MRNLSLFVCATKFNSALKDVITKLSIPYASRYNSHGFHRGVSNGMKTQGSRWATVATLGEWRSLDFKRYVDITGELDRDMSKLQVETDMVYGHWARAPDKLASDFGRRAPAALE